MKKILAVLSLAILSVGVAMAQDLAQVSEAFNNAVATLNAGDKAAALDQFVQTLSQAQALGADGEVIAGKCKEVIPSLYVSAAKGLAKESKNDEAIRALEDAIATGEEYGQAAAVEEAKGLISSIKMKSFIDKASELIAAGDNDGAIKSLTSALELAPEANQANIKKNISSLYIKKAQACYKAKDMKGCLDAAQKSADMADNANAQRFIGLSALALKQGKVAAEALETYLAMSPNAKDKVQITYQLATAYKDLGDAAKACSYYKEIAQDPKFGEGARYQMTALKCN